MSWPGQASEHDSDHSEAYESGDGASVAFEVAGQAAVSTDPGERAFDDPAFGENDEAMQLVALDDLELPGAGLCNGCGCLCALVAGIREDTLDEGEEAAGAPIEDESSAIAILHIGRMHNDAQQEAERVDEDVPLAARDLLARIKALWVERGAPF